MSQLCQLKNPIFYKKTIHILIPVLLQQLISVGINFMDNVMIGSFGEVQIAAVSLANQFYNIFQFVCMGLGSGSIVLSSQYWGAKERDQLRYVAALAMRFTLVIGGIFTLLALARPQWVLGVYTNDGEVVAAGLSYMRIVACTFILYGLSTTATYLLRSTGHVRTPLISSVIAFFLNVFFNWVFIFGMLGFPALGIAGAAVGTLIARSFEFAYVFGYFVFRDRNFSFRLRDFFLSGRGHMRRYLRYSVPVLISDFSLGVGLSMISVIIGHISAQFVAANSIVQTGNQLLTVVNTSMAGASGVVVGNSVGEGNARKAYQEGLAYIILSVAFGLVFSLVIFLFRDAYIGIYDISAETAAAARSIFTFIIFASPVEAMAQVTSKGILRGGGDSRFILWADSILLWAFSLPLGALAGLVWGMSPFWVYFFLKLQYGGKGIVCLIRFFTKRWIKTVTK